MGHYDDERQRRIALDIASIYKVPPHLIGTPHKDAAAPKDPNPKDSIGSSKIPLHLWPEEASALGAIGLLDGAGKYGRGNFAATDVRASIYHDAAKRHLNAWFAGEDADPDSGIPHLGHALACLAILVRAGYAGRLIDDRDFPNGYRRAVTELTPHVARLQALHADKAPQHYTIADRPRTITVDGIL